MREIDRIMFAAMTNMEHNPSRKEIEDDLRFFDRLLHNPDALTQDGLTLAMVRMYRLTRQAQLMAFGASQN